MNEETDMKDWTSKEFDEGYYAWCDMKGRCANPYEEFSFQLGRMESGLERGSRIPS